MARHTMRALMAAVVMLMAGSAAAAAASRQLAESDDPCLGTATIKASVPVFRRVPLLYLDSPLSVTEEEYCNATTQPMLECFEEMTITLTPFINSSKTNNKGEPLCDMAAAPIFKANTTTTSSCPVLIPAANIPFALQSTLDQYLDIGEHPCCHAFPCR